MTQPPQQQRRPESPQERADRLGRPSLLTPERQEHIVRLVRAGSYLNVAAQHAGIGRSTLMGWLQRGRAIASLRDAHDPEGLYCPGCDRDRTADVRAEHDANLAEQTRQQQQGGARSYAMLDPCPGCHSTARPQPFAVPEEELRYLDFLDAVTRADTEAEVTAATAWRAAFTTDWRAARDFLVRRHPDRWAATQRISISSDEADQRIDRAVGEVLAILDGDGDPSELPPELDLDTDSGDL